MQNPQIPKKDWELTRDSFRHFLEWIDEGKDSGGQRYLEILRRLVAYFDRKNCLAPEELADETLNRVARRLEEEGTITIDIPAHYCFVVARFIFLEYLRNQFRHVSLDDRMSGGSGTVEIDMEEQREACLGKCLKHLDIADRELIVEYYRGETSAKIENRRAMSSQLGITLNALSIRACRLRDKLESCMLLCFEEKIMKYFPDFVLYR